MAGGVLLAGGRGDWFALVMSWSGWAWMPYGVTRGMAGCFAIFEGGGAKGLAHIGALKALEGRKVDLLGVAGTSAGAIVAALVAENPLIGVLNFDSNVDLSADFTSEPIQNAARECAAALWLALTWS